MELAIEQIKQLAAVGEPGRPQLIATLYKLAYSLETTNDIIHRYGHMVRTILFTCSGSDKANRVLES